MNSLKPSQSQSSVKTRSGLIITYSCERMWRQILLRWPEEQHFSPLTRPTRPSQTRLQRLFPLPEIAAGLTSWTVTFRTQPVRSNDIRLRSDFLTSIRRFAFRIIKFPIGQVRFHTTSALYVKIIWHHKQSNALQPPDNKYILHFITLHSKA